MAGSQPKGTSHVVVVVVVQEELMRAAIDRYPRHRYGWEEVLELIKVVVAAVWWWWWW